MRDSKNVDLRSMSVSSTGASAALPMPAQSVRPPFADDISGFDYFRSDCHYRHLAIALEKEIEKGHSFILLNGEPTADGELLERALNEQSASRYRATALHCQIDMDFDALVHAYNRRLGFDPAAGGGGVWTLLARLMVETRKGLKPVLILERVEALDVNCFEEILRFARIDQPQVMPVVLLAGRGFSELLGAPQLESLRSTFTSELSVNHLEAEEITGFIRYQLNELGETGDILFPLDKVNEITAAAGGNPTIVNRLAREVLATANSDTDELAPNTDKSSEAALAKDQDIVLQREPTAAERSLDLPMVFRTAPTRRRELRPITLVGVASLLFILAMTGIGLNDFLGPHEAKGSRSNLLPEHPIAPVAAIPRAPVGRITSGAPATTASASSPGAAIRSDANPPTPQENREPALPAPNTTLAAQAQRTAAVDLQMRSINAEASLTRRIDAVASAEAAAALKPTAGPPPSAAANNPNMRPKRSAHQAKLEDRAPRTLQWRAIHSAEETIAAQPKAAAAHPPASVPPTSDD